MNAYLAAQRARYDQLRATIDGLLARASAENRELTETEQTSVREQGAQASTLLTTITELTEIEERHDQVAALASRVAAGDASGSGDAGGSGSGPVRVGGAHTQDRDPGHYRREGGRSFFGDLFAARSLHDETAHRRLTEHNRALDMANEGAGVIPPQWMTSEFADLARQQRRVANAVRRLPLSSAAPMSLPKQTVGTVVAAQSAENAAIPNTPEWASDVDTVSPKALAGAQLVSRQMLDSSNPAVDALIYGDLVGDYNEVVEAEVVAAMVASAGAAVQTFATVAAWDDAAGPDSIVDAAIELRSARKLPADVLITNVLRYGHMLKWKDTSNRPLIPLDSAGPMNVIGTGSVAVDGRVHGLGVLATDGVPSAFPENVLVARASDTILWESPVLRFRYEEPNGPESVRLGIWAYVATYVKYAGASVKRIAITAAA